MIVNRAVSNARSKGRAVHLLCTASHVSVCNFSTLCSILGRTFELPNLESWAQARKRVKGVVRCDWALRHKAIKEYSGLESALRKKGLMIQDTKDRFCGGVEVPFR